MSVSDDLIQPTSDSFWEVDCYKRTTKRTEDGFKLCTDLMQLIQDRADIEKHYAKSLKGWSQKWNKLIDNGPEYGTTQAAWKGVLTEADSIADLHIHIRDQLINEVQNNIKQWQKQTYHKAIGRPCKETQELTDGFKKAQKPWAKKLAKVLKTKKEYHTACKLEKTATHQENNARMDSAVSPDQLKKLQERMEKCQKDVQTTKDRYDSALSELNAYNAKYMEDMTEVFNKSQEFEEKRLQFFKEMMYGIHASVDLSTMSEFPRIYQQFQSTVDMADYDKDLKFWSQNNGVDMAMNWPTFEEYSPEPHSISKKDKKGTVGGVDGITLTAIKHDHPSHPTLTQTPSYNSYPGNTTPPVSAPAAVTSNGGQPDQNPFGDDEWDTPYDSGPQGAPDEQERVPVRALYDYNGQEEDELSFKAGEVFLKILDEDEQGWCTGQKDTKVGLYPKNYVEVIDN